MLDFREELNEFLQSRPYREITVDGARFKYILSGEDDKDNNYSIRDHRAGAYRPGLEQSGAVW